MERYVLITARILMAIMFLLDGLNLISQSLAVHEMAAHGLPASLIPLMILGAQALQLVASLGLIFGIYPRLAALALILFLIPATLMAHAFCEALTHCPCFVDDSLSSSSALWSDGHDRPTMSVLRSASSSGSTSERRSACRSGVDAR
jgi:uncharacterized membrane protein YphA (DoxX/SURF4 family)